MKKLLVLLLLLAATGARAQALAEWFRQGKTQRAYLLEQLAALQLYQGYARQGYALAAEKLGGIGQRKEAEAGLHETYFRSLERVNPAVRHAGKVAAIVSLQARLIAVLDATCRQLLASSILEPTEQAYVYRVCRSVLRDCAADMQALVEVTTDGKLAMTDAERLQRLDALYRAMQEKYLFAKGFGAEAGLLAVARLQAENDGRASRLLHGIRREEP
ncbi:hypothetical protein [Pontibacter liquoris]|uniref:hypothetical protein n=1 Tax=Pontibacter liquoris TaxID=2905677 RepID=UPI001FA75780|nr:hypothetical protein [Pontibacter liquoris]